MIVKFEIESWADWARFNTLFAELHGTNFRPLCAALSQWMRTREIEVRCQSCGWQGEQAEAIKEANRGIGAPPIRCPQCKQYETANGQGFDVVPTTFEVDTSDLELEAPTCPVCGHPEHEGEVCGHADLYGDPCCCDQHGGWVAEYQHLVTTGENPRLAAEMIDASLMPFDEWQLHHQVNGRGR